MITVVVFSKDRPAQLDLLLTSIQKNCRQLFSDIRVLYTYSNDDYKLGYDKLIEEWKDLVRFKLQDNFMQNLKELHLIDTRYLCYFTDDDIVYKRVEVKVSDINNLFEEMDIGCFSLRLGRNTVIQNPVTVEQTTCPNYIANYDDKFLIWNRLMIQGNSNYSYNLSVDGHIFRTKVINNIIKAIDAEHPNDFEGKLQLYINLISPVMSSLSQSCVVNTPVNKVNDKIGNNFGNLYPQTQEFLNSEYLSGKRISLGHIDFVNVLGTHQELRLVLK